MSYESIPSPAERPSRLGAQRRKAVTVSEQDLVSESVLDAGHGLPLVLAPRHTRLDLLEWAGGQRAQIEHHLRRYGAVLFRGFDLAGTPQFEQLIAALTDSGALEYMFRASPRTRVGGNVYTSTDYPADQPIFPHNEHSYSPRFPLRLFFYCQTAPQDRGATPIGSTRFIAAQLPAAIKQRFRERGVLYVRNYGDGFGLPWPTVFQTEDRAEVEAYCASVGIEVEWKAKHCLRTRQRGPAVVKHPYTGEEVWFNHATFFHVTTLPAAIGEPLMRNFGPLDLPTNTFYGDGSAIEPEVLQTLRQAYLDSLVTFPWQPNDVLYLDNLLCVHGRQPYSGPRTILTGMAEALLARDVAA